MIFNCWHIARANDLFEPLQIIFSRFQELRRGQRIVTFLLYLNEGFAGGETDFPDAGLRFKGKTGDAIFWANVDALGQPEPLTRHAGLPPTSGEKWILSQWIRGRPGQSR